MFKIKLVSLVLTIILVISISNLHSQGKLDNKSGISSVQTENEQDPKPNHFKLYESAKTEFDNVTNIKFELGEEANVILTVTDQNGKIIETLIDDLMEAGAYSVNYKSAQNIIRGEFTYKLELKSISGVKNLFAVK